MFLMAGFAALTLLSALWLAARGWPMPGAHNPIVIALSASFFTVAFGCFLFVYLPILLSPRTDGKAG